MYFHKIDEQRAKKGELIINIVAHILLAGLLGFVIALYLQGGWYY